MSRPKTSRWHGRALAAAGASTLLTTMLAVSGPAAAAGGCASGWADAGGGICELVLAYNGSSAGATPAVDGAPRLVTVPAGVTQMTMVAAGAEGGTSADPAEGSGTSAGGRGGRTTATVGVTPGDTLLVIAGGSGPTVPPGGWMRCAACGVEGAFGGGGLASSNLGGNGGGGSFVFDGLPDPDGTIGHVLVAAGGGGGGGYDYNTSASHGLYGPQKAPGGAGSGVAAAGNGASVAFQYDPTYLAPTHYPPGGGLGATPSTAGAGGHSAIPSSYAFGQIDGLPGGGPATRPDPAFPEYTAQSLGVGGASQKGTCCYYYGEAGGGGGGYFGGGGGGTIEADLEGGGGGGGAGYVAPGATGVVSETGVQVGDGEVTLRYSLVALGPLTLAVSPTAALAGQPVTLTAKASTGTLTAAVSFYDGATLIGTAAPVSGKAKLVVKLQTVGDHPITAAAPGSPATAASIVHVAPAPTTTTMVVSPVSAVAGTKVKVVITVKPVKPGGGTPTGSVTLFDGGTVVASQALKRGKVVLYVTLARGTHLLQASYAGGASYLASSSAAVTATAT